MILNISDPIFKLIISIIYIIFCFLFGYIAKKIGYKKNFGNTFFLGFFLHIFGVIILILVPQKSKEELLHHYKECLDKKIITKEQYDIRISKIK